jgi:hypothetical protein
MGAGRLGCTGRAGHFWASLWTAIVVAVAGMVGAAVAVSASAPGPPKALLPPELEVLDSPVEPAIQQPRRPWALRSVASQSRPGAVLSEEVEGRRPAPGWRTARRAGEVRELATLIASLQTAHSSATCRRALCRRRLKNDPVSPRRKGSKNSAAVDTLGPASGRSGAISSTAFIVTACSRTHGPGRRLPKPQESVRSLRLSRCVLGARFTASRPGACARGSWCLLARS